MAASCPLCKTSAKKVDVARSRLGRPKEILETPRLVCTPRLSSLDLHPRGYETVLAKIY